MDLQITTLEDAAASDDHRFPCATKRRCGRGQFRFIGPLAAKVPLALGEEALRPVEGLRLDILAEGEGDGPHLGWIGENSHGPVECGDELARPHDAVEIAGDGPEAIIGRDRAIAEILDLLEHRVGHSAGEDIAG